MISWLRAMSALTLAGCLDVDPVSMPPSTDRFEAETVSREVDVCELLPMCGPCSLLCDPALLAETYVPSGTCALFVCTLVDGRMARIDVCRPP